MNKMRIFIIIILCFIFSCNEEFYSSKEYDLKKRNGMLTNYKGKTVRYFQYRDFIKAKDIGSSCDKEKDVQISYVYVVYENDKKYLGECLYYEYVFHYEYDSSFSGSSSFLGIRGRVQGNSWKEKSNGVIKFCMIEFNPFKWYEIVIPIKNVFLINGKYIEDISGWLRSD